jgi:hypothetical protein
MTTAFRSWLSSGATLLSSKATDTEFDEPTVQGLVDDDADDGEETEREDDDRPAAFPAPNSAQRATASLTAAPTSVSRSAIPAIVSTSPFTENKAAALSIHPLPDHSLATRTPGVTTVAPRSGGNTLMLPPTTLKPPTKPAKREKVALAPGFGPLDWANLKSSGADLKVRAPNSQSALFSEYV